jgi:hypothetical protein
MAVFHRSSSFSDVENAERGFVTSTPRLTSVQRWHGSSMVSIQLCPVLSSALGAFSAFFHAFLASSGVISFCKTCIKRCGPGRTPCLKRCGLYGCANKILLASRTRLLMM